MSADYKDLAVKGLKGACWYTKTLSLNMLRRGLILGRYTLACWQKQKVNKAMRRLGEQFFQALEQGETNPLVVSAVSDAVNRAKDLKAVKDKNYQAVAATREKIRAAWVKEPPPAPAVETPPPAPTEPTEAAEPTQAAEKPEKPEEPAAQ
jgi:hypothetical protein